jgi:hypothetical protein
LPMMRACLPRLEPTCTSANFSTTGADLIYCATVSSLAHPMLAGTIGGKMATLHWVDAASLTFYTNVGREDTTLSLVQGAYVQGPVASSRNNAAKAAWLTAGAAFK